MTINQFIIDYYNNFDLSHWQNRLKFISGKLQKLKKTNTKAPYIIELYSLYRLLKHITTDNLIGKLSN